MNFVVERRIFLSFTLLQGLTYNVKSQIWPNLDVPFSILVMLSFDHCRQLQLDYNLSFLSCRNLYRLQCKNTTYWCLPVAYASRAKQTTIKFDITIELTIHPYTIAGLSTLCISYILGSFIVESRNHSSRGLSRAPAYSSHQQAYSWPFYTVYSLYNTLGSFVVECSEAQQSGLVHCPL